MSAKSIPYAILAQMQWYEISTHKRPTHIYATPEIAEAFIEYFQGTHGFGLDLIVSDMPENAQDRKFFVVG